MADQTNAYLAKKMFYSRLNSPYPARPQGFQLGCSRLMSVQFNIFRNGRFDRIGKNEQHR